MNNAVFTKTMENERRYRDSKLVTTEKKKKLFGVRTKLSYCNIFHRKCIDYKNEKNSNI